MKYYSQIEQDKYYIENIIKHKTNGKFLDVGANDGITESNTYCLEKDFGWSGICVEANETLAKICETNRPSSNIFCSLVWSCETVVDFVQPQNGNNLLSRIDNIVWNKQYFTNEFINPIKFQRKTTTLKNILGGKNHHFDYFSLDVEGAELEALKGIDWSQTSFDFMSIEFGNRDDYLSEITKFLHDKGYERHRINKWDAEFMPK
jgi:FkbM family methyltransferase